MKKRWLLIGVIGMMAVLIIGMTGSGAWFTDVDESLSTSVETGNFDLVVTATPFDLKNLEPGADYVKAGDFCVRNAGNYDMQFKGYLKDVVDEGNLRSYLLVKIEMLPYETYGSNYGPAAGAILANDVPFTQLMGWNDYIALKYNDAGDPAPFYAGYLACYRIHAKLSSAAGNAQIKQKLTAKLYMTATQWINKTW